MPIQQAFSVIRSIGLLALCGFCLQPAVAQQTTDRILNAANTTITNVRTAEIRQQLVYMREQIGALLEDGGTLQDIYTIDQSAYAHLDTFDDLATLNASTIFRAMEFE